MITLTLIALALVAITVLIHVAGLTLLVRWMISRRWERAQDLGFWSLTWLFVRIVWALMASHVVQIAVWAGFYRWKGGMPDLESAVYFSAVTYTTIGYGDVLVNPPWRILATVEGLTGIVMCSLSAAFFFSVMVRLFLGRQAQNSTGKK